MTWIVHYLTCPVHQLNVPVDRTRHLLSRCDACMRAARAALAPTVKGLQASALLLLDRLIEVGKTEAVA